MKENTSVWELFYEVDEYPTLHDLRTGLKEGVCFSYVSNSYVDGMINYLGDFVYGVHFEKYNDEMPIIPEKQYHTRFSRLEDDKFLVFQDGRTFTFVHYDWDVSDCSIGWFPKDLTFEQIKERIQLHLSQEAGTESGLKVPRYVEIPKDWVTGWLSF